MNAPLAAPAIDPISSLKSFLKTGQLPDDERRGELFAFLENLQVTPPSHDRFVAMRQLPEIVGYSRRWIIDRIEEGTFPQPIRINERRNIWRMSAIQKWMDSFEAEHQGVSKPTNICKMA